MNLPNQIQPVQRSSTRTIILEKIQPSVGWKCDICRASCTLLDPVKRIICEAGCNTTVCKV